MDSTGFNFDEIRKILHAWVDEMYPLEKGCFISNTEKTVLMGDSSINRKQVKHIIKQRKADGRSLEEIKIVFEGLLGAVGDYNFEIQNTNQDHPGSVMRIRFFKERKGGIVVVMDRKIGNRREIITAFERNVSAIERLRKKLQESTPGETPHP